MKKYSTIYARALASLMVLSSTVLPASTNAGAMALNDQEVLTASSSGALNISKGRVIVDNDAAFEQKMAIIAAAKTNLYLTYYIYSDDYSSSAFNLALIQKAQSGVKVHLMVDLATNYSKMDLFRFLVDQGNKGKGSLEVRFYNKPSPKIQEDAFYLTVACSHANQVAANKGQCEAEKKAIVAKGQFTPAQQAMQKLYLASFYTKNGVGMEVATAGGQQIDIDNAKKLAAQDKSKQQDFKKLAKTGKQAKDTGSLSAAMSAKSLMSSLVNEIDPSMNFITGMIPVDNIQKDHKDDWDHISDYTHQKMILADIGNGQYAFELGGRNIEDSYHLKEKHLKELKVDEKQKYLFRDTDFYGVVQSGGEGIVSAFMRNWDFTDAKVGKGKGIVATMQEMDAIAPIDLARGVAKCGDPKTPEAQQCIQQFFVTAQTNPKAIADEATALVMKEAQDIMKRAAKFQSDYVVPTNKDKHLLSIRGDDQSDELSGADLKSALVTYIENLNTRKDTPVASRTFGAYTGKEMDSGKYISYLWQRGMENACLAQQPTEVILHSAYLLPSSSMVRTLGKMIDGTWDCSKVTIRIITNSFETTDLNIINILARAELQAVFNKYFKNYNAKSARIAYYEYVVPQGQTQSLHTKTSLLGNDMIIGSANADIRSYYMDANNAVFIRNAQGLVADYKNYIYQLINNKEIVESSSTFGTYSPSGWALKDYAPDVSSLTDRFMEYWINKAKDPAAIKTQHAAAIHMAKEVIQSKAQSAYEAADAILNPGSFKADAATIRKACGNEPDYNPDNDFNTQNYNSCVSKTNAAEFQSVDPDFNLELEAF